MTLHYSGKQESYKLVVGVTQEGHNIQINDVQVRHTGKGGGGITNIDSQFKITKFNILHFFLDLTQLLHSYYFFHFFIFVICLFLSGWNDDKR